MKRSRSITLVLLGGGIMLAGCGESTRARECREATAAQRPDAEQICARSQARSSSAGSWFYGRTAAQAANLANRSINAATISRGGFGARGASGG